MNNSKNCDCQIHGIKCEAKNCVYNKPGCICDAGHIEVGTNRATCSAETVCTTFKCKN